MAKQVTIPHPLQLVRQIGEHHWNNAYKLLISNKNIRSVVAGKVDEWEFVLERNQPVGLISYSNCKVIRIHLYETITRKTYHLSTLIYERNHEIKIDKDE